MLEKIRYVFRKKSIFCAPCLLMFALPASAQTAPEPEEATRVFVLSIDGESATIPHVSFFGKFSNEDGSEEFEAGVKKFTERSKSEAYIKIEGGRELRFALSEKIYLNNRFFATKSGVEERYYFGAGLVEGEMYEFIEANEPAHCPLQSEDWLTITLAGDEVVKIELLRTQGCLPVRVNIDYDVSGGYYLPNIS